MNKKMNIKPEVKEVLEWVYCIIIAIVLALLFRYYVGTNNSKTRINETNINTKSKIMVK